MVLEKISPIGPESPSRKGNKSSPDRESFSEMLVDRTRKVGEVDPEEQKRRRLPGEEESDEDTKLEKDKQPSPYEPTFHETSESKKASYNDEETQGLPSSREFWEDISQNQKVTKKTISPEEAKKTQAEEALASNKKVMKAQAEAYMKLEEQKGLAARKKATEEKWTAKERFGIGAKEELPVQKTQAELLALSEKRKESLQPKVLSPSEKTVGAPISPLDLLKQEKKASDKEKMTILEAFSPPLPMTQVASQVVASIAPTLPSEVSKLFEHMVATVIFINQKGIEKTQVLLTSPAFANSRFYGATIEISRYSTAPNSYNIVLSGNPEAMNLFSANIDGLREIFDRGDFSFSIGRISAELTTEKPIFRRKEPQDQGQGGMKNEK